MMNISKITEGVYYVGVNDRTTDRFEGLWSLPNGVSYNSYIVRGDTKTALIDTVEVGAVHNYFRAIFAEIGESEIDYLVVNHMEPDHSGGIPMILSHFPNLKIVGNKHTIAMIKGFYHINDDSRFMEVKDGDVLDLGGKSLKVVLTPMVHWPETMMTYLEESGVIFSGDAFGCFGALNGGVVDTEMNTDWYWDEMYRYYSNIVGKYGRFVQKALEKTSGLTLKYICPTHGPIWHENIAKVVDIYDRLSKYESEPGVTIIFGSMYGNTGEIAESIARQLAARGVKNIKIHNAAKADLSYMISDAFRYEGLIVGGPTYSMHLFPPVENFMIAMETREIKNKVFATFGSFTWASAAAKTLGEYLNKMKMEPVATLEMKHSASESTYTAVEQLAESVVNALKLK
ncbi:MAG: FprA family A-type flavoprotein [Muribaculaceae bacterium]|nr:FprA family A-type flavoprotein [Muribaculaceae bacterium]